MLFPLSRGVTHQSCLPVLTSTRSWVENFGNKAPRAPTSAWYHSKQSRSVSWSLATMPDFCVWVVVQQLCQAYLWAINSGSQYNGKERCGKTALWELWWAFALAHIVIALYFSTEDYFEVWQTCRVIKLFEQQDESKNYGVMYMYAIWTIVLYMFITCILYTGMWMQVCEQILLYMCTLP